MEVFVLREVLPDQARPDDLTVDSDEAAVRLVAERDLRDAGDDGRIQQARQHGHDKHHQECGLKLFEHKSPNRSPNHLYARCNHPRSLSIAQIAGNGAISPPIPYTIRFRLSICAALCGRYRTPRSASGTRATMINALKITAANTALAGVRKNMMFSFASAGYVVMNIAGMMAKYFETSFMIENVVSAPRVMRSCLPMATTSISFVGLLSRSTMLPASRAAVVPVFIARPTSACARAGASLVPSPVIAIMRPPACSFLMYSSLSFGVAWAMKSSTPASDAIAAAVNGLSPVTMTDRMPIARSCAMRSFMPTLTMSLRLIMPSSRAPSATASGVPPAREIRSDISVISGGTRPPCSLTNATIASVAPLRSRRSSMSTPLIFV